MLPSLSFILKGKRPLFPCRLSCRLNCEVENRALTSSFVGESAQRNEAAGEILPFFQLLVLDSVFFHLFHFSHQKPIGVIRPFAKTQAGKRRSPFLPSSSKRVFSLRVPGGRGGGVGAPYHDRQWKSHFPFKIPFLLPKDKGDTFLFLSLSFQPHRRGPLFLPSVESGQLATASLPPQTGGRRPFSSPFIPRRS